MKTFKEFIGTTGVRVGGVGISKPMASMGDNAPKKKGIPVKGAGLQAGYTTSDNQRPFLSADPKVEPKNKKKENTMGGMVHVRGAQGRASLKTPIRRK
jgi:hypothetical protein|tara:strand:+ start:258 stop:551 length:294 start_codon:yes stop_codon:yes gene_type:complete